MRIGILSDVHGNLPALEAVLANLQTQRVDSIYCLGDVTSDDAAAANWAVRFSCWAIAVSFRPATTA